MVSRDYDQDVILYAKGWYEKTDVIADLKRIYSLRNGIDAEYIQPRDIIICLSGLVFPYVCKSDISGKHNFCDFISELGPGSAWKFYDGDYDFNMSVICKFLSVLKFLTLDEIVGGITIQSSPDVLPLRKHEPYTG